MTNIRCEHCSNPFVGLPIETGYVPDKKPIKPFALRYTHPNLPPIYECCSICVNALVRPRNEANSNDHFYTKPS